MRGINFGWLAVWVPSPDSLCHILELCDICQVLRWSRHAWGRECGPCPDFAYSWGKSRKTSVRVTEWRSAVQRRRDSFCRLGHRGRWPRLACCPLPPLAFASGDGVNPRSAYLPSCRTRGFPTSANLESKLSARALMWSANSGTTRYSCICLLLT